MMNDWEEVISEIFEWRQRAMAEEEDSSSSESKWVSTKQAFFVLAKLMKNSKRE